MKRTYRLVLFIRRLYGPFVAFFVGVYDAIEEGLKQFELSYTAQRNFDKEYNRQLADKARGHGVSEELTHGASR